MSLSPPVVAVCGNHVVVRDDLLEGGTKRRAMPAVFAAAQEVVFAGPAQGWAQVALGYGARDSGKPTTVFIPRRRPQHNLTAWAASLGVRHVELRPGRLSQLQARARDYAAQDDGRMFLPLGLFCPELVGALQAEATAVAARLLEPPPEVWCVAGGGALAYALGHAFPDARLVVVQVGREVPADRRVPGDYRRSGYSFDDLCPAELCPPFPSNRTYDAKAWQAFRAEAPPESLFWNVAS